MGTWLRFYSGHAEQIETAVRDCAVDTLDEPGIASDCADFSLHITPHDLDLLSQQIGRHSHQPRQDLQPHLSVVVDEEDRGFLSVDAHWVDYVATLEPAALSNVVRDWFLAMQAEYGDEQIKPTKQARQAVESLVRLCRRARDEQRSVSHVWFL